jgi:hypothetical protein
MFVYQYSATPRNLLASQKSVDLNDVNIDKFNSDLATQYSDVRMLVKLSFLVTKRKGWKYDDWMQI